jgi:hypothetical protein
MPVRVSLMEMYTAWDAFLGASDTRLEVNTETPIDSIKLALPIAI